MSERDAQWMAMVAYARAAGAAHAEEAGRWAQEALVHYGNSIPSYRLFCEAIDVIAIREGHA